MASFNRADYARLVQIARLLYRPTISPTSRKRLARELFTMVEEVVGQQSPPLEKSIYHDDSSQSQQE